ncbi:hypothetical protein [Dialister sp.]|uniref:hypothetical protein n=1 Tax=Dialister sp. TaxID=1955814 RepID=UPI002E80DB96|nr:hypothetical protein [Dialister sp.]MEE3452712.1 hypothetical protein [Dialister sp.]
MEKEYDKDREESIALSKKFAELEGRRPRIYVPEMDDDGCGEKRRLAASAFADCGWDVDVDSLQSPEESARNAVDNDDYYIYYYSESDKKTGLLIRLEQALAMYGRDDILVAAGPVEKEEEKEQLFRYGLTALFPNDYSAYKASLTMLRLLITRSLDEESDL